jgi:hypothetical protein
MNIFVKHVYSTTVNLSPLLVYMIALWTSLLLEKLLEKEC